MTEDEKSSTLGLEYWHSIWLRWKICPKWSTFCNIVENWSTSTFCNILENITKFAFFLQYFGKCVKINPLFAIFRKMCQNCPNFCDILEELSILVHFLQYFGRCVQIGLHFAIFLENGSKSIHCLNSWKWCPHREAFHDTYLEFVSNLIDLLWSQYPDQGCSLPGGTVITLLRALKSQSLNYKTCIFFFSIDWVLTKRFMQTRKGQRHIKIW